MKSTMSETLLLLNHSVVTDGMRGRPSNDSSSFLSRMSVWQAVKAPNLAGRLREKPIGWQWVGKRARGRAARTLGSSP